VEVTSAKLTVQTLNLQAGIVNLSSVLAPGSPPLATGVSYVVYETVKDAEGNRKRVVGSAYFDGPPRFPLPAGRYYVAANYGRATASTEVQVTSATVTIQTLNLRAGILNLSSVLAAGSPPLATGVSYVVEETVKDAEGNKIPAPDGDHVLSDNTVMSVMGGHVVSGMPKFEDAAAPAADAAKDAAKEATPAPAAEAPKEEPKH
jgi:hypothetical protein